MEKSDSALPIMMTAIVGFLSGLIWLGYDVVMWLKEGYWPSFYFTSVLNNIGLGEIVNWAYYPQSWIGLSKIIKYIIDTDMWLFLLSFSTILFFAGAVIITIQEAD